jgi:predicted 2-oxoglutarate/Fe(II)-dependent dioxygenase YbiX
MKHIIQDFIHPEDAKKLIAFFEKNEHLCFDVREFHKDRNIHYSDIKDQNIKNLLMYYGRKNIFFIDHYFKTKTTMWQDMRLCRWKEGHFMPLHVDRQPEGNDTMDFSSLMYLNDDYKGGELSFLENKKEKNFKMKAFSCVIFPSAGDYVHGVKKVLKGKRYTIPSWYIKLHP